MANVTGGNCAKTRTGEMNVISSAECTNCEWQYGDDNDGVVLEAYKHAARRSHSVKVVTRRVIEETANIVGTLYTDKES